MKNWKEHGKELLWFIVILSMLLIILFHYTHPLIIKQGNQLYEGLLM